MANLSVHLELTDPVTFGEVCSFVASGFAVGADDDTKLRLVDDPNSSDAGIWEIAVHGGGDERPQRTGSTVTVPRALLGEIAETLTEVTEAEGDARQALSELSRLRDTTVALASGREVQP